MVRGPLAHLFFDIIFLPEALDTPGSINKFLLARKEGVTGGTDFHLDVFYGGTGFDHISAGAAYLCHLVFGMNLFFHVKSSSLSNSGAPA